MINTCSVEHRWCNSFHAGDQVLPTRLIEIHQKADSVGARLILSRHQVVESRYMTLSYCWGGRHNFMLTRGSLDRFQHEIPLHLLPKTLQDAVKITQWFNIQYLWIDSLCIIQDDPEDWFREASAMCDVYRHSYLNIAALKAPKSTDGCFALRNTALHHPCSLFENNAGDTIVAHPPGDGVFDFNSIGGCAPRSGSHSYASISSFRGSPLPSRGWVVQERLLAPRTVYFGDLLFWECGEDMRSELSPFGKSDYSAHIRLDLRDEGHVSLKENLRSLLDVTARINRTDTSNPDRRFVHDWSAILDAYTKAQLSFAADRLNALLGIIEYIKVKTGLENYAGLWKTHFEEQLLWSNCDEPSTLNGRAPSWSWLSNDCHVQRCLIDEMDNTELLWLASVQRAEVKTLRAGSGRYETYLRGTIHLRTAIFRVGELYHDDSSSSVKLNFLDWPGIKSGYCGLDRFPSPTARLFFLPFVKFEPYIGNRGKCLGLLVTPSAGVPRAFERLGVAGTNQSHVDDIIILEDRYQTIDLV
jgi:hypothetical protein